MNTKLLESSEMIGDSSLISAWPYMVIYLFGAAAVVYFAYRILSSRNNKKSGRDSWRKVHIQ